MKMENKRYVLAVATLFGTIVGVGIFGVPAAISKVGVIVAAAYFVLLTAIQVLQGLFYAEAAIAEPKKMRFVGLVRRFIGPRARHVAAVTSMLGFWGGMVAYILVGGTFLHILLSPLIGGTEFMYQLVWAIASAFIVYKGLDFIAKFDFLATVAILVAGLVIIAFSVPHADIGNMVLKTENNLLIAYGVILFSLSGLNAIPELEDILKGRHKHFRQSIVIGTVLAAVLTAAFGFVVYAVTGGATTDDAVSGLSGPVGPVITGLAAVFGFFAVATSYLTNGMNLRETFEYDYSFRPFTAWLIATGAPVAVFLLGAKSFVAIISFTGAVFYGIIATLVGFMYVNVTKRHLIHQKDKRLGVPFWVVYLTMAVLLFGAGYEFLETVRKFL